MSRRVDIGQNLILVGIAFFFGGIAGIVVATNDGIVMGMVVSLVCMLAALLFALVGIAVLVSDVLRRLR